MQIQDVLWLTFFCTAVDWNTKWKTGFVSLGRLFTSVLSLGSMHYNPKGSVLSHVCSLPNKILTSARLLYWRATSVGPTSWTGSVISSVQRPLKTYRCDNMPTPWTVEPKTHPRRKFKWTYVVQQHICMLTKICSYIDVYNVLSAFILYKRIDLI